MTDLNSDIKELSALEPKLAELVQEKLSLLTDNQNLTIES